MENAKVYINNLLQKEIWTGQETGRAYLYNRLLFLKAQLEGGYTGSLNEQLELILSKVQKLYGNDEMDFEHYKYFFSWLKEAIERVETHLKIVSDNCKIIESVLDNILDLGGIPQLKKKDIESIVKKAVAKIKQGIKEAYYFSSSILEIESIINIKGLSFFDPAKRPNELMGKGTTLERKMEEIKNKISSMSRNKSLEKEQKLENLLKEEIDELDKYLKKLSQKNLYNIIKKPEDEIKDYYFGGCAIALSIQDPEKYRELKREEEMKKGEGLNRKSKYFPLYLENIQKRIGKNKDENNDEK
ncbi:MAG: hypothetical protein LBR09_02210 [Endomicrobium sp.]|jgi:hypothetical protein|nr:hypothetical protein [Endomicrobium sp.]